jgi:hypothetical protein
VSETQVLGAYVGTFVDELAAMRWALSGTEA